MPRRLRSLLDDSDPGLVKDRTTSQIVDIVREAQRSLFERYMSSNWFKVNGEWKKIEYTSVEGSKPSDLTFDARTEPDEPDTSTTRANESIIPCPPPSTGSGYEATFEYISSSRTNFLDPGWLGLFNPDEAPMSGSNIANNLSSELPTSSGGLSMQSLTPSACLGYQEEHDFSLLPTPYFLDLGYLLPEEAGHTGIELASHGEDTSNSAESQHA
ncbi:hypothetical protein CABS01_05368 [Colletotrichum abscissum]|uniref:uncharacterized protein n=1 Tax=Colletotrichum abscissum TaxID=1671311 RepID=UPI0027D61759|nr:uncharacterized protein CABS01_05368 [Colletotrichum abscissum]KAK1520863.1 hypothetical protein CABS01_05368 [Colletotrichum abscissum]